ncbi:MAG: PTS sugar transporter subunit IIA [Lachnospiraceae bacterium]|nr:PTS sugar transporter subunit IIA [Lachnospiraceae bacterium]
MIIREFYEEGLYAFAGGFACWEDAVLASIEPLVERGMAERGYGKEIIDSVKKYGPYINISELVSIPHAGISPCVHGSGMAMMITREPVDFGEESEFKPRIFFAFCSTEAEAHLERLQQISDFCSQESQLAELLALHSKEELEEYLRRKGEDV